MKRAWKLGLAALSVLALSPLGYAAVRVAERARFVSAYSSYGAGPDGTRALLLLSRSLGRDARPFTRELSHLPRGTLVSIAGCRAELSRKVARPEREALTRWVEAGGLLIVAGRAELLPEGAGLSVARQASCPTDDEGGLLEQLLAPPLPEQTIEPRMPGELTAEAAGPPLTHLLPFRVQAALGLRIAHDAEATELLTCSEGPLGLTAPFGRGRVVLLGIPDALTNAALSDGGGLVFARLLRAFAPAGPVLFDEYHLGMGERRSLIGYFRDAGYSALLAQLLLALCVSLLAAATRLAPARELRVRPRAVSRSFFDALSALFERSRDSAAALSLLSGHALARIGRHYHARHVPSAKLESWLKARGLFAVASYVGGILEHERRPLGAGESLKNRAQAIERDETAAIVIGEAR